MKNKIIELVIAEDDDLKLGVDAIALVEMPAIEETFLHFKKEEFVEPRAGENEGDFIGRCMSDLSGEFPEEEQRLAVCYSYWEGSKESFESYTDYPESATAAAKRALEWRDAHPDQKCGTAVGWTRANQLANREPISEETIARMASFARHKQNSDTPYSEGCGGLMWDAWGGTAGIEWASNKLEEIREEMNVDTSGLTPYVDQTEEEKKDDLLTRVMLEAAARLGFAHEKFANAEIAPNIGDSDNIEDLQEYTDKPANSKAGFTIYKYEGPTAERQFCRQMLSLNRWYTYQDIKEMENIAVNTGFGEGGSSTYSIWKYKGGVNCKHHWQKYYVNVTDNKIENKGAALGIAGDIADRGNNWYRMSNEYHFADDRRVVTGPAMIPDIKIPRKGENGEVYYVYFTKETIQMIAEKFMRQMKLNQTNIEHNSDDIRDENYVYESWIIEDPKMDKSKAMGFELPTGTWMISMRVMDDTSWKLVKEGKLKGFSVEGFFGELREKQVEEDLFNKIVEVIQQWDGN